MTRFVTEGQKLL